MKSYKYLLIVFISAFCSEFINAETTVQKIDNYIQKSEEIRWDRPLLAKELADSAFNIANKNKLTAQLIRSKIQLANCYYTLTEYDKCESLAQSLVLEAQRFNNEELLARVYLILGTISDEKQDYENAVNFYFKSEEIYLKLPNSANKKPLAEVYFNLGIAFLMQRFDAESLEYFQKALDSGELSLSNELITYNWLAKFYLLVKDFNESEKYYKKALDIAKKNQSQILIAYSLLNRSNLYLTTGEIDLAKNDLIKADSINKISSTNNNLALAQLQKSKISLTENKYSIAEKHIDSLWYYINTYKLSDLKEEAFKINIDVYVLKGEHSLATEQFINFQKYQDSIFSIFNTSKIAKLSTAYNLSQLQIEKEKQEKMMLLQNSKQKNYIYIVCIVLVVLLALIFNFWRMLKRNKKLEYLNRMIGIQKNSLEQNSKDLSVLNSQLKMSNESLRLANLDLENFVYVAAHDIKAPVRTISQFVNILNKEVKSKDNFKKELFGYVLKGTQQINSIIDDVLKYSQIQTKSEKFVFFKLSSALDQSIDLLHSQIIKKKAKINKPKGDMEVFGSADLFLQMLVNLIDNGIKYSKKGIPPEISITFEETNTVQKISIQDNGIGISKQDFHKLFLMFKRLHSNEEYEGTGIGLASCMKIAKLLNGTIEVASEKGIGTKFTIILVKKVQQ